MLVAGVTTAVVITFLFWIHPGRYRTLLSICSLSSVTLILMGSVVIAQAPNRNHPELQHAERAHHAITLTVTVESYPRVAASASGKVWLRARAHHGDHATPLLLFLSEPHPPVFHVGQQLRVTGVPNSSEITARHAYVLSVTKWSFSSEPRPGNALTALQNTLATHSAQLRHGIETLAQTVTGAELVPGFAVGATNNIPTNLNENLKKVSLTHLTAVSGANCALVVGAVVALLKCCLVPRKARIVCAALALGAFALIVGPDASLQRAAVMGTVVLISQFTGQTSSAYPALGIAILVLLLGDPWMALDPGFALSVHATLSILIAGRAASEWCQRVAHIPRWIAQSLAITCIAQLACTPILLHLQGVLSVTGVLANLFAAPVAPIVTILGLVATLTLPIQPELAHFAVWLASIPARWVSATARTFAHAPIPPIPWPQGWMGAILYTITVSAFITGIALKKGQVSLWGRRRAIPRKPWQNRVQQPLAIRNATTACFTIGICIMMITVIALPALQRLATPNNWAIIACDVGQGDAILIRHPKDPSTTVLIDTGNQPDMLTQCLKIFNIDTVTLLVLSHDDKDHIGAIDTVLPITQKALVAPPTTKQLSNGRPLTDQLTQAHIPHTVGTAGTTITLTEHLKLEIHAPKTGHTPAEANAASLIITAHLDHTRILLLGDTGETEQRAFLNEHPDIRADIIKVAHHGSRDQYRALAAAVNADWAVVSVGAENTYGHPARDTLRDLQNAGSRVLRTDVEGSIALYPDTPSVAESRSGEPPHTSWKPWVAGAKSHE